MLKIQIMGGAGSGKTTLGAEISARFNIPFYEMDVLGRKNGRQHTAWLQDAETISALPGWVTDGGSIIWNDSLLAHANYIVLLDLPWRIAAYRIVRRHIIKSLQRTNRYPGIRSLIQFLRDGRKYYLNQSRQDLDEAMQRCLDEQRADTELLDSERLLTRLERYGVEVITVPTAAFLRHYLEKYKQKLIVIRNNADRARLLDFLTQQHASIPEIGFRRLSAAAFAPPRSKRDRRFCSFLRDAQKTAKPSKKFGRRRRTSP